MSDDGRRIPALEALEPADRADASEARRHIRANFDAMTAARDRGVSWQQITDTMTAAGVRAENGDPLDWRQLKSLFHTERYARGGKRKRRAVKPKALRAEALSPEPPAPAGPEPPSPPAAADTPANPWAETDRRSAETRRRRDERAAGAEWNPYATKEKPE